MKKFIAILLVIALLVMGGLFAYAMAEATEPTTRAAPLVDLTGVIIAVVLMLFDFLLAWIAKVIVPPIREWLGAHTSVTQRSLMWDAICKLVDAAEQTIIGPGRGKERLAYVVAGLQDRGFTIDSDMIEAAVKRMNDRLALTMGEAFEITNEVPVTPIPMKEDGTPDLEIMHWNVDQLRSFCLLNGIPVEGCVAKEDYINAIERGGMTEYEDCKVKDYCDLDDDGNPVHEEPQSAVE